MTFLMLAALAADPQLLEQAVYEAIRDEIGFGLSATKSKDMDRYIETVPDDYRIVEDDGSITGKASLRAKQQQAWKIIVRTHALEQHVTGFQLSCSGECAIVWTSQQWDRDMLGRDGISVHNVVTTQDHKERWELRGSRWVNVAIVELGGRTLVDGKSY